MVASLRAGWRLFRVGLHLLRALATAALVYPRVSEATRCRLKQRWSATLLRRLGVVLDVRGAPAPGALLVANHISWLDIYVINALIPAVFVAKAEVRQWPLIGWLCVKTGTLFVTRGSSRDTRAVGAAMGPLLAAGRAVAIFPEGTTSDGGEILPFKPALLQPAVSLGVPVQPLFLRYFCSDGERSTAPAYCGETTLWQSLWAIARERFTIVELDVLPSVEGAADRRVLAVRVEAQLRERMSAPARPPEGSAPSLGEDVAQRQEGSPVSATTRRRARPKSPLALPGAVREAAAVPPPQPAGAEA